MARGGGPRLVQRGGVLLAEQAEPRFGVAMHMFSPLLFSTGSGVVTETTGLT